MLQGFLPNFNSRITWQIAETSNKVAEPTFEAQSTLRWARSLPSLVESPARSRSVAKFSARTAGRAVNPKWASGRKSALMKAPGEPTKWRPALPLTHPEV
jgi:hypothetical protein